MSLRFVVLLTMVLPAAQAQPGRTRSPRDLALSPDGRWALAANAASDTVSLVDLVQAKVVAELPAGRQPFAVAWKGSRAAVSNLLSDDVTLYDVVPPRLTAAGTIPVGDEPRGVLFCDGGLLVVLAGEDAVARVDLGTRRVVSKTPAGVEPWHATLTPDGARLAVGAVRSQEVRVLEMPGLKLLYRVPMRGHNLRGMAVAPDGAFAYVPNIAERGLGTTKDNIDRGWVVGNRLSRVPLTEEGPREAVSLDQRGKAVADVEDVAVSPDGLTLALPAGGTHELILLRQPLPYVAYGGPGDHIDAALLKDPARFRRVDLGGRPVAARFAPNGGTVWVANFLRDELQEVDAARGVLLRTVALGDPAAPSLARRGEEIFYDGRRSFHQWYSCHTCHVDGHTNGSSFDTLNDGRHGNLKQTPSLRGVIRTGPWTWHGWQTDFRQTLSHSLRTTMQGPQPSDDDLAALAEFVRRLDFVPPPALSDDSSRRGEILFKARGCAVCHKAPDYTHDAVYAVGLESPDDVYPGFNPPSLRGVSRRGPWLHDGRSRTLEDLLLKQHRPSTLSEKPDFNEAEVRDLLAFLRTL